MDYAGLTAKLLSGKNGVTENSDPLMNRMEDKYLVSRSQLEKLTSGLREHLREGESDTNARFNKTQTTYLDTKDLDCFRDAVSGIKPRFKVRIRQYAPNGLKFEDVAYLELKIKTQEGMTKKTRIRVPKEMVAGLAEGAMVLNPSEELVNLNRDVDRIVLDEKLRIINSTLMKYGFRRQIVVQYERRAYANDEVRVTVDDHIVYFDGAPLGEAKDLIDDVPGIGKREKMADQVRNTPYVILEVKHRGTVPAWLESLMKEVGAERVKFSKYATAIIDFAKDGQPGTGKMTKDGLDVSPLMALFQDPVAKGKKSKDLVNIAYVVLRDKNFVLIGKRENNGKWGLPGGRFEEGEDRNEVALRELKEETGIKLKPGDLTYEGKKIVETDDEIKTVHIFSAKHPGGEPKTKDGEYSRWEWIRCENGMLPKKILEGEMNGPTEAAFEKVGLTKSDDEKITELTDKLAKASNKTLFYVAVVPVNTMGHVLVGERREDGIWTTPAGGAELGESPEDAAVRECFEECGLIVDRGRLELLGVKATPSGKPIHCFLYRLNLVETMTAPEKITSRLDPDKEVEKWEFYRKEMLPEGLSRQKNLNRLETINQALMRFHGLTKAELMNDEFEKGGPGSGIKGHRTAKKPSKDARIASNMAEAHRQMVATSNEANLRSHPQYNEEDHKHLKGKGYSDSEIKAIWDRDHKDQKKPVSGKVKAPDAVGHAHGNQKTPEERLSERLSAKGIPKEKHHLYTDKKYQRETSVGVDALGNDLRPGEESKRAYAGMPQTRDSKAQAKRKEETKKSDEEILSLVDKLSKGGPGSGVKGHVTAKQPSPLHPHVASEPAKPINKLGAHLQSLQHGGVMPGMQTQSGKPIANDMEVARAHGYDVQDHVDAMNAHYELANKTQQMLDKLKMAGHKVPEEGKEIAKFHQEKMKEHMKARAYLEKRKEHVAAAMKEQEGKHAEARKKYLASLDKSTTQMGGGLGDRDLDIGAYAQAKAHADGEWLEKLYGGMREAQFGDLPQQFQTDKGVIHLAKVDDGLYSGWFTSQDHGMEDNAKVRIERITIPELVQLMSAKEWIAPPAPVDRNLTYGEIEKFNEGAIPAAFSENAPQNQPVGEPLMKPMEEPVQAEPARLFNREELAVRLISLVDKLLD